MHFHLSCAVLRVPDVAAVMTSALRASSRSPAKGCTQASRAPDPLHSSASRTRPRRHPTKPFLGVVSRNLPASLWSASDPSVLAMRPVWSGPSRPSQITTRVAFRNVFSCLLEGELDLSARTVFAKYRPRARTKTVRRLGLFAQIRSEGSDCFDNTGSWLLSRIRATTCRGE